MRRVLIGVRLQLVAWPRVHGWPWLILGIALATNVGIFAAIGAQPGEDYYTGGLSSIYCVFAVSYIQSMTQVFPFAVGYGLTRRAFYASVSLLAVGQSVVSAVVLAILSRIEIATDGWAFGVRFFLPPGVDAGSFAAQVAVYAVPFMLLAFAGIGLGLVFKRWGANGLWALAALAVLVVGGALVVFTARPVAEDQRRAILRQISDASITELWAVWPLPIVAVLAATGFAGIRRATP